MTSCFTRPTVLQSYQDLSALFSANVLGGAPIIPESNEYYLLGNDVAAQQLYYSLSNQQWLQTLDATACDEALIANNAPLGLAPKGATFASGYISIVGGPANDPIPSSLQCQIGSNVCNLSLATNANPTNLDSNGNATLMMTALVPGASVNASINTAVSQIGTIPSVTATLSIVPPGWPSSVSVNGNFCGGYDEETIDQFRARVIARKQIQPNADFAYIEEQALNWPCVTRVMLRTCGDCCNDGQMQLYAFMDNSFANGIVPQSALAGLNTYIFGSTPGLGLGKAPCGLFGSFFQVAPIIVDINFYNMSCITADQFSIIQDLITDLFATLKPGQTVSSKWINAIVMGVNPNCTKYTMNVTPLSSGLGVVDCFNDFSPVCDALPVIGSITYSSQLAPQ